MKHISKMTVVKAETNIWEDIVDFFENLWDEIVGFFKCQAPIL